MLSILILIVLSTIGLFVYRQIERENNPGLIDFNRKEGKGRFKSDISESFLTERYCEECNTIIKKDSNSCPTCGKQAN